MFSTHGFVLKDMVLDDSYHVENVYVAALIEQDHNRDILTGGAWGKVAEFWANNWMKPSSDAGRVSVALAALMVGGAIDNDEMVGVKSVPQIFKNEGTGTLLVF